MSETKRATRVTRLNLFALVISTIAAMVSVYSVHRTACNAAYLRGYQEASDYVESRYELRPKAVPPTATGWQIRNTHQR